MLRENNSERKFEEGSGKGNCRSEASPSGKNDEAALHNRQALNWD